MAFGGRLLSGIMVLAAVVESGSFAHAGEAPGLTPSGISRAVARLEARMGVRLFDRTTRVMTLIDEGHTASTPG
jgi:DNA-binding transcriptional LysR family regulator